ncbi:hypothetical protein BC827DRAFT_1376640 [Russula dissimulans]|nr:hypothetical protein BC827DRAFT_1376640 [Russula dissimulans]
MTTLTLFLLFIGLWSSIHLIHRLYRSSNNPRDILPISLVTRKRKLTTVTLTGPYLRVESTAFNSRHDTLARWLSRSRAARVRTILLAVFDTGIVVSLLGMAIALVVLAWTFVQLARRSMMADLIPQSADPSPRAKRAYDSTSTSPTATDVPVQLLIPGITLPLSHLPLLISALFVSQTIHEAGHALAAALDNVPLQSLGASLTVLLPAAFVAFPAHALAASAPRVRARIAAAGPLLSSLLCLILLLPLPGPLYHLGYSDISTDGSLVASVTPDSPLASHLSPGTLLTALDDLPLAGAQESAWSDYLTTSPSPLSEEPAWCLDTEWFLNRPHGCCATPPPGPGSEACLIPIGSDETSRCVDAQELLVPTESVVTRCEQSCAVGQTCVRLRRGEQFLRISVQSGDKGGQTRVVLWRGQREEIYYSVAVTRWRPRLPLLPLWLPSLVTAMIIYTRTLTLSLFLLNVLPLSRLDGGILIDTVLCHLDRPSSAEVDIEIGSRDRGIPLRRPRGRFLSRILQSVTAGLLGGCVLLGVYDSIIRIYVQPVG